MIMIETLACEESAEDFAQVGILRFVVKATRTDMIVCFFAKISFSFCS